LLSAFIDDDDDDDDDDDAANDNDAEELYLEVLFSTAPPFIKLLLVPTASTRLVLRLFTPVWPAILFECLSVFLALLACLWFNTF
jgi:hypothetical protein